VEEVEAEEGGNLVSSFDIVVADGAFACFALVVGLEQTGPILFDGGGVDLLGVDPKVYYPFLHHQPSVSQVHWVLPQHPWNVVACTLMPSQLELSLHQNEQVVIPFHLARNPALSHLHLVLTTNHPYLTRTILNLNAVALAMDGDVHLRASDGDGTLVRFQL
jgi:hypothetical protein